MSKYNRQSLLNRIAQLQKELKQRGVKPDDEKLHKFTEDQLIDYGKELRDQLAKRKKFLGEEE